MHVLKLVVSISLYALLILIPCRFIFREWHKSNRARSSITGTGVVAILVVTIVCVKRKAHVTIVVFDTAS